MWKKIVILFFLLVSTDIFASRIDIDISLFYAKIDSNKIDLIKNLSKSDEYFKRGYMLLSNKKEMKEIKPSQYFRKSKQKAFYMPNYVKAVNEFSKSVKMYNNPLSAYLGLRIIKLYLKQNTIQNIKRRLMFVQSLYETTTICQGYIEYADMLTKGIGQSRNFIKALKVLKEAREKCWGKASDWEKSIIDVKETQARYKQKLFSKIQKK